MSGLLRNAVALGAALMMTMSPALAAEDLGIYQTTDRKMDFGLSTCGSSGKDLCVTLLDARGSAATRQVKPYIGKVVVNRAKPSGKNVWKGTMKFGEFSLSGQMVLRPGKSFKLSGCVFLIACSDFNLIHAE